MSGFRKFRSSVHRRRRALEAAELGYLATPGSPARAAMKEPSTAPGTAEHASPLEFSPSREAVEIGPAPIAWHKPRKPETDN